MLQVTNIIESIGHVWNEGQILAPGNVTSNATAGQRKYHFLETLSKMGKWKTLGAVVNVSTQVKLLGQGSSSGTKSSGASWSNVLAPVKATRILGKAKSKNREAIRKTGVFKPNPEFKRESWKKSNTAAKKSISSGKTIDSKNGSGKGKEEAPKARKPSKGILKERVSLSRRSTVTERKKSVQIIDKKATTKSRTRKKDSKTGKLRPLSKVDKDDVSNVELSDHPQSQDEEATTTTTPAVAAESKYWRKIRLMLVYMKMRNPSIINLGTSSKDASLSLGQNLQAMMMADKFKDFSQKQKNGVPRCGGSRGPGEFDYMGIYRSFRYILSYFISLHFNVLQIGTSNILVRRDTILSILTTFTQQMWSGITTRVRSYKMWRVLQIPLINDHSPRLDSQISK